MNAVILVDLQNDFLLGGALAVPTGDEVIPVANRLLRQFELVVATQDWHPVNHVGFAANHPGRLAGEQIKLNGLPQMLWPIHCVQYTSGARLAADLDLSRIRRVFQKGTDPLIDSYSGFFDNGHLKSTGLGEFLKLEGVSGCYVLGLATDYCVKFTALDARTEDFETYLVLDGCRGVELAGGDVQRSIEEMVRSGVKIVYSHEIAEY
jgi:nicotinamidase/pyrazinamidase